MGTSKTPGLRTWPLTPINFRPAVPPWPCDLSEMGLRPIGSSDTHLDRQGKRLFGGGDSEMIRRIRASGLEAWFVPARGHSTRPHCSYRLAPSAERGETCSDSGRRGRLDRARTLRDRAGSPSAGNMASRRAPAPLRPERTDLPRGCRRRRLDGDAQGRAARRAAHPRSPSSKPPRRAKTCGVRRA